MRKFFNCKIEAGFEEVSEPRLGGWNRNTDLCVDVKTILRTDRVTKLGKDYTGVLTHDGEDHLASAIRISSWASTSPSPFKTTEHFAPTSSL